MAEITKLKNVLSKWFPRFFKASVWSILTYLFVYYIPLLIFPLETLPIENAVPFFDFFVVIVVFFAFITKLFSGMVYGYALNIVKTLIMIAYFITVFKGGIIFLSIPFSEFFVYLRVDLTFFLVMLISMNLLYLAKTMLELIRFLSKKTED